MAKACEVNLLVYTTHFTYILRLFIFTVCCFLKSFDNVRNALSLSRFLDKSYICEDAVSRQNI